MLATPRPLIITWDKLPDDYLLPDDPVDNRTQPALAEALSNALRSNQYTSDRSLTATNYAICATVNGHTVVKAPDWFYVSRFSAEPNEIERSYTPQLQGDFPIVVMEFLSETEETEYSVKPTHPPGKWFFYEQVLKVPVYIIFEPHQNILEVYRLDDAGKYQLSTPNDQGYYWLPELKLFLGTWFGHGFERTGHWLRWWDTNENLLLWSDEQVEQERERADKERARAEKLLAQLRAAGIDPVEE
ncbi:MAG: Uma2 family endonuclease [Spirulina sp. SIO3F2]|nr:Uma2 family endonuclease [Spirulina sp. SIO3F2]